MCVWVERGGGLKSRGMGLTLGGGGVCISKKKKEGNLFTPRGGLCVCVLT